MSAAHSSSCRRFTGGCSRLAAWRRLFEAGSMAVAVRAGRQHMWEHDKRTCVRGEFPLQDWLLPVLYQQDPLSFSFVTDAQKQFVPRASKLPEELRSEKNPDRKS